VREFQVFVPVGQDRLAAALTAPDERPEGLVVLMTGMGPHRSHRFGIWARTGRELARRGIASVRFDYRGMGESTGLLGGAGVWYMADIPVDQAIACARFGMEATGARSVAAAGNCGGAWAALELGARMPECAGVAFIRAPILAPVEYATVARKARRSRLKRIVRSNPLLHRLARVAIDATSKGSLDLMARYRAQLEHGSMMFLFCEEDYRRGYESKSLEKVLAQLSPEHRARCTRLIIPGRSLQELELSTQDDLIRTITDWAAELFSERPSPIVV
jgi:pimeloyl-ACP methyl ester carboxylesterase